MVKVRYRPEGVQLFVTNEQVLLKKPHHITALIEELEKAKALLIEHIGRTEEESIHHIWENYDV